MSLNREAVLEALGRVVTRGIRLTALADDMGVLKHEYAELREQLDQLVSEGVVTTVTGGAYALAPTGRPQDRKAQLHAQPVQARLPWGAPPKAEKPEPVVETKPEPEARRKQRRSEKWAVVEKVETKPVTKTETRSGTGTGTGTGAGDNVTGRITVHPAGYGFVAVPDGEDVFIPAKYRGESLDGDRVVVSTWLGYKGTEGRVVEVVARGRARLTGTIVRSGRTVFLQPDDPRIAADYGRVALDGPQTGQDGDAVVVEITRYPTAAARELAGRIVKVLGDPGDPRTEIEKIIAVAAVPVEFPDDCVAQAKATPQEVRIEDRADRIDLRDRRFCTIDPETARDFDDALCIEDGPHGGPRVWVAVADVAHYVRWEDALDRESVMRGVSVYLPDRVIPMLPFELSAEICSLKPNVDRCAMVVRLDYKDDGTVIDTGYAAAVIRSQARLDYPGVAAALRGDFRGRREIYRPWIKELEKLDKLGKTLRALRSARGAAELDIAEAKVVLDADDPALIRDVVRAKADPDVKEAYELVESFMIAANEAVGRFFRQRGAPSVWRVHAPPKRERLETLAELLGAYGVAVDVEEAATPLGMKAVLDQVLKLPASRSLSFLVLRSLKQAVWDTVPIGHFGLASGDYLHFTSPIRRYPDVLVHRLLKYHLHREGQASGGGYSKPPPAVEKLSELAATSSGHERRAMEAEREAVSMYRAHVMRDQIGEVFTGTVSAVTSFGAFVEIDEPFVEGLIKTDSLGEAVSFDEVHMRLTAKRSGRTIALGDTVQVEIADVSVARRRIELRLLAVAKGKVAPAGAAASRAPQVHDIASADDYTAPEAPATRVGLAGRRKAGRAVEQAVRVAKGGPRSKGKPGGKAGVQLRVSHRSDDGGGRRGGKPGGKPGGKGAKPGGKPKRR